MRHSILAFCLCFIAIFISHSNKDLGEFTALYADGVRGVVSTLQEQNSRQYQRRIGSFLDNTIRQDIKKAFVDGNREELIRISTPYFELFKSEDSYFATFTWILLDNTSYLHMHDIHKPSKDISEIRPDIVAVKKTHRQYSWFVNSAAGMQYCIVHLVSYYGKHIGILHFGLQVGQFMDAVHEKLQISVGMVFSTDQYRQLENNIMPGSPRSLSENALSESRTSLTCLNSSELKKIMLVISHIWLCLFSDNSSVLTR